MPRFESEVKLDFKDVLIRPKRSTLKSRSDVDLTQTFSFKNSKKSWTGVPIIAANMDTVGTFEMASELSKHRLLTAMHKFHEPEAFAAFCEKNEGASEYIAISSGMAADDLPRVRRIVDAAPTVPFLCLDVANGYSEHFIDHVRRVREEFPRHTIMAGNVVTGEIVEELLLVGADIIKVGIGPGSVCTTRKQAGVGYPQLSAIFECGDAACGLGGHIIGDGGITCPGDVAKAIGGGADFAMIGGLLAGHDESGGDLYTRSDGKKVKLFYGMSSTNAMKKHSGGVAEYRSSEGKAVEVPYRGGVGDTVRDILGGVRSACTYVGCAHIADLSKRTTFIRVSAQLNETFRGLEIDVGFGYSKVDTTVAASSANTTTTSNSSSSSSSASASASSAAAIPVKN